MILNINNSSVYSLHQSWVPLVPPRYQVLDLISMTFLALCLSIGAPINMILLYRAGRVLRKKGKSRGLLLKVQITISDLFILTFYALTKLIWHITIEWKANDALCKIVKYLQTFSFQFSSATLTAIGIDRLAGVLRPFQSGLFSHYSYGLIVGPWVYAGILSLPQLFIWKTVSPPVFAMKFVQCATFWADRAIHGILLPSEMITMKTFDILNYIIIFWGPFTVMCVCYCLMIRILCKNDRHFNLLNNMRFPQRRSGSSATLPASLRMQMTPMLRHSNTSCVPVNEETINMDTQIVSRHGRSIHSEASGHTRRPQGRCTASRMVGTCLILMSVYFLCWLPYHLSLLSPRALEPFISQPLLLTITDLLIVLNSVANPFIYGSFGRKR